MGDAKSYVERLFDFPAIDALSEADARLAILVEPARKEHVEFEDAALDEVVRVTSGYPYFLQEWGACGSAAGDGYPDHQRGRAGLA